MTTRPTYTRAPERAIALPAAILLAAIAVIMLAAATSYTMGRVGDHDRRRDRVVAVPIVDTAITRLRVGLERDLLPEHNDFMPTEAAMSELVAGTGATLVAGSPIDPQLPASVPNVTVLEPIDASTQGYWQVLQAFAPEYAEGDDDGVVVIYVRAWTAPTSAPASGTEPRIVRVEFRPGRFADYQAVIDGPIVFGPGAELNGPIHSNGFTDERANFIDSLAGTHERVWATDSATVTCSGAAQITTATGDVDASDFPGCPIKTDTKRFVNLLAAEEAFERIQRNCGSTAPTVHCFHDTYEGSSVPGSMAQKAPDLRGYRVTMNGDSVTVGGYEVDWQTEAPVAYPVAGAGTYPTPAGSTTVLMFGDNVVVEGSTNGRVTIASRKEASGSGMVESGSANIYIVGDVGHDGDGSVLGLLSQGGIILGAIKNPDGSSSCVSHVRAGMVAMSGTLTIDPRYTTRLYQDGAPQCGPVEITGALAAHRSPVLYWRWANVSGHAGFSTRDYSWNDSMRRNPPPYFPITDTWQPRHVRPANLDCFAGGTITDPDC